MGKFGNYEYEVIDTSQRGDDFKTLEYKIRNSETRVEFKYTIQITVTALNCDPRTLMSPIYEIVNTRGEFLVKNWLSKSKEVDVRVKISERNLSFL